MYRTHNCGELRKSDINSEVVLCGWVQRIRNKGFLIWIDLRDRYGITQLFIDSEKTSPEVISIAKSLGREFVVSVTGKVIEREASNEKISTGEIEISVENIEVLNESEVPPFTIENESDGGDELRMKYRYLDLRRDPLKNNIIFRNDLTFEIRKYLKENGFIDLSLIHISEPTRRS